LRGRNKNKEFLLVFMQEGDIFSFFCERMLGVFLNILGVNGDINL